MQTQTANTGQEVINKRAYVLNCVNLRIQKAEWEYPVVIVSGNTIISIGYLNTINQQVNIQHPGCIRKGIVSKFELNYTNVDKKINYAPIEIKYP